MNQKEEPSKVIQTFRRKVLGSNFGQNAECSEVFVILCVQMPGWYPTLSHNSFFYTVTFCLLLIIIWSLDSIIGCNLKYGQLDKKNNRKKNELGRIIILKEKGKVTKEGRRKESEMTYSLFCDLMQRWFVVSFRRFGTTYRSHLKERNSPRRMLRTFWCVSIQGMLRAVSGS